ncbi:uncharacterized protein LOC112345476 isoform X1 [Selaginella moellendorffii]|uniref:uncharacterized protein LOC112345476 isoform X1 n=1 Tax=Selaginella moellendorffii TaxID=88036 RepID=UPI000D1C3D4A|nr:uncharacterized protein LOC112345476 isoform X1 [Selaginella moellendorffii]|eukprot:XP_024528106.1 uncharacterized protein LOC112345476 isoform X1 [Selaginella moellendorffii]
MLAYQALCQAELMRSEKTPHRTQPGNIAYTEGQQHCSQSPRSRNISSSFHPDVFLNGGHSGVRKSSHLRQPLESNYQGHSLFIPGFSREILCCWAWNQVFRVDVGLLWLSTCGGPWDLRAKESIE